MKNKKLLSLALAALTMSWVVGCQKKTDNILIWVGAESVEYYTQKLEEYKTANPDFAYGFDVKGMVAGLGITATIIGLALQDTFKDIISGISIIFENYFIVGDVVTYNNFTGEVIEFGLKSTKIKNVNGEVLTVANRNIMEIKNISQKDQTVLLVLGMKYEDNVDKVEKVIINDIIPAIQAMESVNEGTCEYMGISELADSCVKYQIKFKCEKETQWQAKRDANKIALKEMRRHNLSFAYPQMEVHNGR